jgi:hypothetical protein
MIMIYTYVYIYIQKLTACMVVDSRAGGGRERAPAGVQDALSLHPSSQFALVLRPSGLHLSPAGNALSPARLFAPRSRADPTPPTGGGRERAAAGVQDALSPAGNQHAHRPDTLNRWWP